MPTVIYTGEPLIGSDGRDLIVDLPGGTGPDDTMSGGGDGDLLLGDWSEMIFNYLEATNTTRESALNIDDPAFWSVAANPAIGAAGPHTSIYVEPAAGQVRYFAFTVGAGATITVDIDFAAATIWGGRTDSYIRLLDSNGAVVAANDDSSLDDGSINSFDPRLSFAAANAGTYYLAVMQYPGTTFAAGKQLIVNVTVTGHEASGGGYAPGNDALNGEAGDDILYGMDGDDVLDGGEGQDRLDGGGGADVLYGGAGNDTLLGLAGDDQLYAGVGSDNLDGGEGNDILTFSVGAGTGRGGAGNDELRGGDLDQALYGDAGDDLIAGGAGFDSLYGGDGDDVLDGGSGNDRLSAGTGLDRLSGGDGDDTLFIETTPAALDGGSGIDTLNVDARNSFTALSFDLDTAASSIERVSYLFWGSRFDDAITIGGSFAVFQGTRLQVLAGTGNDRLTVSSDAVDVFGEAGDDTLTVSGLARAYGGIGNDTIQGNGTGQVSGGDGTDTIEIAEGSAHGDGGDDIMRSLAGGTLFGDIGNDRLSGSSADDTFYGEQGADLLTGGAGDDLLFGGEGADIMVGGVGNDIYFVDQAGDIATEMAGEGNDWVRVINSDYTLGQNLENLKIIAGNFAATGNGDNNIIVGSSGINIISGLNGDDALRGGGGRDVLDGGDGADALFGEAGSDILSGGRGSDAFIFTSLLESSPGQANADRITDFDQSELDRILLTQIDAVASTSTINEAFTFIGTANFGGVEGQLRYYYDGTGDTLIQLDVNGDSVADMTIRLDGEVALTARDFVL